ncbi:MAG TPA: nucleotide disphospho-sugar-binding domain-containing protein [Chthoniobacterales bacterium]|nr:nucleotide disphospho-sugar-binding domain-containing protein [Chthoniobacterales bacterium]
MLQRDEPSAVGGESGLGANLVLLARRRLREKSLQPFRPVLRQLVLSIGDQLDPKQIGPMPRNAIVVKRAPQLEVLRRASVCITHAGLNTVLESLAQGVPQVAIPLGLDQPAVAARIAAKQTGVVTSLDKLTPDHLSTLLREVLNNSTYRDNARKLQRAIGEANGLSVAADLVEESLGVTK